jgi:hypothetical protein
VNTPQPIDSAVMDGVAPLYERGTGEKHRAERETAVRRATRGDSHQSARGKQDGPDTESHGHQDGGEVSALTTVQTTCR